jgi:hypothetical protein
MPDFSNVNQLLLFLVFFVPGFLSLRVWDLLIPGERRDFTKTLADVAAYSALNWAPLIPPLLALHANDFPRRYPIHYAWYLGAIAVMGLLVLPICWPLLWRWIISHPWVARRVISPIQRPWDWVFMQRRDCFLVVTLKSGRQIAGAYQGPQAFATSFPAPEQLYLTQVISLDEEGNFLAAQPDSAGIIILSDILTVEIFVPEQQPPAEVPQCPTGQENLTPLPTSTKDTPEGMPARDTAADPAP